MRMRSLLLTLVSVALLSVLDATGKAQTSGEITGLVTDQSDAAVSGATVTVTNKATGAIRQVPTNSEGLYTFPSLLPGVYELKVEQAGFKTARLDNITLAVQQTARLDVKMEVGAVGETVTVSGDGALLNAENATVGAVIENKIVTELPLNGRNYLNLVALAPNVNVLSPGAGQAGSRQGGDRAGQSISTGGQRIMFNYYTLDGVNNTDPNFNTYVALPSIDAIQEFKVQIGVYPAEYGHQSTQVNVLTKSGGNAYHGALFEFLRNDAIDAKPYAFTSVRPNKQPFKWNDYGFEADGPVRIPWLFNGRDKLFFMSNYEAFRLRQKFVSTYTVPTQKMFEGDFSDLLPGTVIYDPLTRQPFPGNVIPRNRLDPISQKILKYYHTATLPGLTLNHTQINSAPQNRDMFVLRLDFNESPKSQWMGRYNWGEENQSNQGLAGAGNKLLTDYKQYTGANTRTLTSNLVNDVRFGYTRFFNSIGTLSAFTNDVVADIGIPGQKSGDPVTWGIPNVNFTGFTGIGDANDGPYANDNNTLQFVDKVSWLKGKHSFAFGFEYNRQNYNQIGNQFSRGVFSFQPNATRSPQNTGGDGFAEFLLGHLWVSTNAVAVAKAKFQRNAYYAFIDDTWKIRPKLTLSLGLRYELTPPFTNTLGDYFNVKLPKLHFTANAPQADWPTFVRQSGCTDPYQGLNIRWTQSPAVCGGGLNHNLMKTQYNNFAPRIGLAYTLSKNTVIRSGFGIFYVQDIGNAMYFDLARNIAGRVDVFSNVGTPTVSWSNAIPGGNGTLAQIPPPYAFAAAYDHHTSYTMQYLLNVQRQIGQSWVLEAGYLGSVSRHLYGFLNANQAVPAASGNPQSRVPFPQFGVIQLVGDGFNASYNAGSVKVTRRFGAGLSLNTSYTWAKSMDNSSGIRNQGFDTLFPQNSACLRCEWALSAFDTRHRFSLGSVYELPVGKGKLLDIQNSFANVLAGGWQLSGNMTIQSGVPQSLNVGFVNSGTNTPNNDRPNFTGKSNGYAADRTPSRWYDPAAFEVAPAGTFGNLGRNAMITPSLQTIDLALHKNFRLGYKEGHRLQFRVEGFNALNHPVWGAPNGNIRAGQPFPGAPANAARQGFGVINNTRIAMRQIQFGLKYVF